MNMNSKVYVYNHQCLSLLFLQLRKLVNTNRDDIKSTIIGDLIHETALIDELHPCQLKAITRLFKQVFLTAAPNRPQAKVIKDQFFHVCRGQW